MQETQPFEQSLSQMDNGYVFGPVPSRRLGRSIGINLFTGVKTCNYRCIYCECDVHNFEKTKIDRHLSKEQIRDRIIQPIAAVLASDKQVTAITFAGNGEPTLHQDLPIIYQQLHELRESQAAQVKIVLLTNGSQLTDQLVQAFTKNGDVIQLKFDAATPAMYQLINDPRSYPFSGFMTKFKRFGTAVEIQTMCLLGTQYDQPVDILSGKHWAAYLNCMRATKPISIHLYSLQRPSISTTITSVPLEIMEQKQQDLEAIGIPVYIYGN